MAVDMFLLIKDIPGESQDADFGKKGGIDVLAWSWGMSQSGTTHLGSGGGSGKVSIQDLSFTKYVDKASANLMKFCCNGQTVATAQLTVRKAGGAKPLPYIVIDMETVMITSVSSGGSGGEDRLTENVTLNFSKVKFTYAQQDAKGGLAAQVPMGWDIAGNVPV
jgi:type VI secretion system secreted protein Hcp